MGRKKNRASNDDDYFASLGAPEPEPEPEPAPAANANAGADADADAEIIEDFEVFEEDADDEPAMDPKEEQAALLAENPEESFLGRQLFALRLQQDNDNLSLVQLALVWFMWWLLTRVASYSLVDGVERRFLLGAKDRAQAKEEAEAAAAAAEAEAEEARRRNELWSEAQQKWMPRKLVTEAEPSVEWSEDKGAFVRYRKDPQDPSKEGAWMRCRPEEGWGTAPGKISFRNTDLRPGDVRFYACYGYPEEGADGGRRGGRRAVKVEAFECTEWVKAELEVTEQDIIDLRFIDNAKPFFKVSMGDNGLEVSFERKVRDLVQDLRTDDGGEENPNPNPKKKAKKSKAEKKAKKAQYGR